MKETGGLLKNMIQLAAALGVSPVFVKRMKYAGFRMAYGGRSTLADAMKWLRDNPDFVPGKWTSPRGLVASADLTKPSRGASRRRGLGVGKVRELHG